MFHKVEDLITWLQNNCNPEAGIGLITYDPQGDFVVELTIASLDVKDNQVTFDIERKEVRHDATPE